MANTRIYGVQDNKTGDIVLVESFDASRAVAFVAKVQFEAKPISSSQLAKMLAQGYTVFQAQKSKEI